MKLLTLLLILLSLNTTAQFFENFSDSNFSSNPAWYGNTTNFKINASKELQLNAPSSSDTSVLYTASKAISNASWMFNIKLDFNPSSANLARVILASVDSNMKRMKRAYFVEIGGSKDEISLYYVEGNKEQLIIDGSDKRLTGSPIEIKVLVKRDQNGNWLLSSKDLGSSTFIPEGSAFHDSLIYSNFFGISCKYSSTRSDKFFFDSIMVVGNPFVDSLPPQLLDHFLLTKSSVHLEFDERIDSTTAMNTSNYNMNAGIGSPATIEQSADGKSLSLYFSKTFIPNLPLSLIVENLEDTTGNKISTINLPFEYVVHDSALIGDILITEIMADPEPSQGLPEAEYIELYNISEKRILMKSFYISDLTSSEILPDYLFEPDSYAIICRCSDSLDLSIYGNIWCADKLPSLNNTDDLIILSDSNQGIIDSLHYYSSWFSEEDKKSGGWSLERKAFKTLCNGMANWDGSINPSGGSPGKINSINNSGVDSLPPQLVEIDFYQGRFLKLIFSELLDTSSAHLAILQNNNKELEASLVDLRSNSIKYSIKDTLKTGIQLMNISGISDCSGNLLLNEEFEVIVPSVSFQKKVLLNEILFDPYINGSDFVEIYNNSADYFDLRTLVLSSFDLEADTLKDFHEIIKSPFYLKPNSYLVITEDSLDLKLNYPYSGNRSIIQTKLPNMSNTEGTIVISDTLKTPIDRFDYSDEMHFTTIEDPEGISLERIRFEIPAGISSNWHSAAKDAGYGTPGYQNSQYRETSSTSEDFTINPKMISPDNDGLDDILSIHYQLDQIGYLVRMTIYDTYGNEIGEIVNNEPLGQSGTLQWNGLDSEGKIARMGVYILLIQAYHEASGESKKYKLPFVVAQKLPH